MDEIAALVELHAGLDRLGPGDREHTLRALAACGPLPHAPRVLDLGCGTGAQSLVLAEATGGHVTAVDRQEALLERLRARAEAAGLAGRVRAVRADMADLPFPDGAFDLVWCEGAAYAVGFDRCLDAWRRLLAGSLVVSELSWLVDDPPEAARAWWAAEYPPMRTLDGNRRAAEALGYRVASTFAVPATRWESYYGPLRERLAPFAAAHTDDPVALAVVEATRREMELAALHGSAYGYGFLVLHRV